MKMIREVLGVCVFASCVASCVQGSVAMGADLNSDPIDDSVISAVVSVKTEEVGISEGFEILLVTPPPGGTTAPPLPPPAVNSPFPFPTGDIIKEISGFTFNEWTAIGKTAWAIIQAGKATLNCKTDSISFLPNDEAKWAALGNWNSKPSSRAYRRSYKNAFGQTILTFTYLISYNYGGSLAGKGHYLANLRVIPFDVDVNWGMHLASDVQIRKAVNVSSADDPNPSVEVDVNIDMEHFAGISIKKQTDSFVVNGLGAIDRITPDVVDLK